MIDLSEVCRRARMAGRIRTRSPLEGPSLPPSSQPPPVDPSPRADDLAGLVSRARVAAKAAK